MVHTMLLYKLGTQASSQRWAQFETTSAAMEFLCFLFEEKLKKEHPQQREISYGLKEIGKFIDGLPDLAAMVLDQRSSTYAPKNKQWVKDHLRGHLERLA